MDATPPMGRLDQPPPKERTDGILRIRPGPYVLRKSGDRAAAAFVAPVAGSFQGRVPTGYGDGAGRSHRARDFGEAAVLSME